MGDRGQGGAVLGSRKIVKRNGECVLRRNSGESKYLTGLCLEVQVEAPIYGQKYGYVLSSRIARTEKAHRHLIIG